MPPITTTVADTIYMPDGSTPTGTLVVSTTSTWESADGYLIMEGYSLWVPVVDGVFSIDLVPNAGSPPSVYSVKVEATQQFFYQEWLVPQPGSPPEPVGLIDVIVGG